MPTLRAGLEPASSTPRTLAFAALIVAAAVFVGCGEEATAPLPQVTVTAVTPSEGPLAGGTPITIQGTNFSDVIEGTIGGVKLNYFLVRSTTEITGLVGAVPDAGAADVVVTSRTHGTGTCEGCFSYYDPHLTVTAVSPDTGNVGKSVPVTITGTGFVDVTSVTVGGMELEDWTVVSSTEIRGTVPAENGPGNQDVVVTSSRTGQRTCEGCFISLLDVVAQRLGTGYYHACALSTSGTAYCWGANDVGQLGDGSNVRSSSTPVAVAGDLKFRAIATGGYHTCGLTSSGMAYCWGAGELGDGTDTWSNTPVQVVGGLRFTSLTLGITGFFTCGLTRSGRAYCWGRNDYGRLGSATPEGRALSPTRVRIGLAFRAITAGNRHACALTGTGMAYCWGQNLFGALGDGTRVDRHQPTPVSGDVRFELITAGGGRTCGLTDTGTTYCWGSNSFGSSNEPVSFFEDEQFTMLDASYHACGITTSGTAYCWGGNAYGQLGNGTTASSYLPVEVAGNVEFSRVSVGGGFSCGLTDAGAFYCWGANLTGQLGNGTLDNSTIPVVVLPFAASPPL